MSDMSERRRGLSHDTTALTAQLRQAKHSKRHRHGVAWVSCPLASLACSLLLLLLLPPMCEARGRLVDPPSRASMWRYDFSNPVDFNDDRVDCGGFERQWRKNQGRCGVCGDPWDLPEPRPHETRGRYARGIIVRNYTQAQAVVVEVEVTAVGSGHFEYQLCPRASAWTQETQECFTHALKDDLGRSQIPVNVTQKFARLRHVLRLPQEVVCLACILQWRFVKGGRAGREEYRACADVTISPVSADVITLSTKTVTITPVTDTTTTTDTSTTTTTTTPVTDTTITDTTTTTTTSPVTDTTTASTATNAGTISSITAKEGITEPLPTTPTRQSFTVSNGFASASSSQSPAINFSGFLLATRKPALNSQRPQGDAPPTHTRRNDLVQNDRSDADKNGASSHLSASPHTAAITTMLLLLINVLCSLFSSC